MVFVVLDVLAVGCAGHAVLSRRFQVALRGLFINAGLTFASFCVAAAAVATGFSAAGSAVGGAGDPNRKAQELAEGMSVGMNGAVFGMLFTMVAGLATLVCLVASIVFRANTRTAESNDG